MNVKPPQDNDESENNDLNLSTSTAASQKQVIYKQPKEEQKKIDLEFKDNFSFGTYLDLIWRIEYLEQQLQNKRVIGRQYEATYISEEPQKINSDAKDVEAGEDSALLKFDNK